MSANYSPADWGIPAETVFRGNDDLLGQEQLTPASPAQGKVLFNFTLLMNIVT
jgi:hypothetical protein